MMMANIVNLQMQPTWTLQSEVDDDDDGDNDKIMETTI